MAYDSPDYSIRREHCNPQTTAGATLEGSKFRHFQAIRLKKAHAVVVTAGTAAGHGYTIKNGTTSIGTITLGTSAAGVAASSALLDTLIPSLAQVSATSLADATGVAQVMYEYEVTSDAIES